MRVRTLRAERMNKNETKHEATTMVGTAGGEALRKGKPGEVGAADRSMDRGALPGTGGSLGAGGLSKSVVVFVRGDTDAKTTPAHSRQKGSREIACEPPTGQAATFAADHLLGRFTHAP